MTARFVSRPVEPKYIEAIRYDGTNIEEVAAFVGRIGGEFIEWIDPARWVAFEDGREGFPVPLNTWITYIEGEDNFEDIYDDEEFRNLYQPID